MFPYTIINVLVHLQVDVIKKERQFLLHAIVLVVLIIVKFIVAILLQYVYRDVSGYEEAHVSTLNQTVMIEFYT